MTVFLLLRLVYGGCLIVTTIVGMAFGGRSERAGTLIVLAGSVLTAAVGGSSLFDWAHNRTGLIVIDLLVLAAFLHLALTSRKFWPLWATAFHLIAVCSHCIVLLQPNRILQIYAVLQGFWAYPIMVAIILGTVPRRRRRMVQRTASG